MSIRGNLRVTLAAAALATLLSGAAGAEATDPAKPPPGKERHMAPIVEACVDKDGKLVSTRIAQSSGFADLDKAALKVANASKFSPGVEGGKKMKLSCVKFKVKFVIKDGESPADAKPETPPG